MTSQVYVVRILGSLLLSMGGCSLLFGVLSQRECAEEESQDSCLGDILLTCRGDQLFEVDCTVFEGSICDPINKICSVCGDGFLSLGEECDDGNQEDNDGCQNDCTPPICGDGVIATVEACDDLDTLNNCCTTSCNLLFPNCELEPNNDATSNDDILVPSGEVRRAFLSDLDNTDFFGVSLEKDVILTAAISDPNDSACSFGVPFQIPITLLITRPDNVSVAFSSGNKCQTLRTPLLAGDYFVQVLATEIGGLPKQEEGLLYALSLSVCGDGQRDFQDTNANGLFDVGEGEACDDGNLTSGDGCRADCQGLEDCGDSLLDPGEQFDDGNVFPGDGLNSFCNIEPGYLLESEPNNVQNEANPLGIEGVLGGLTLDGVPDFFRFTLPIQSHALITMTSGIICDEGAGFDLLTQAGILLVSADETPFPICADLDTARDLGQELPAGEYFLRARLNPTVAIAPRPYALHLTTYDCGNGVIELGEECEGPDGVTCDPFCQRIPICGDGFVDGQESCDDSNNTNGDGCDANCTQTACGNGILTSGEVCDDSNTTNGDGCDVNCTPTSCGNGVISPNEECDPQNSTTSAVCDANCQLQFNEAEPNEDGSPSIGGDSFGGNDFSTINALNPFPDLFSETNALVVASIFPAGDEDVFRIENPFFEEILVALNTDNSFEPGPCPDSVDTVITLRDEAGNILAQNNDLDGGSDRCSFVQRLVPPGQVIFGQVTVFGDNSVIGEYLLRLNVTRH